MKVSTIQKNVSIHSEGAAFPLSEMEVGDSFNCELEPHEDLKTIQSTILNECRKFSTMNMMVNENHDLKFTTRSALDQKSVRCWRIK